MREVYTPLFAGAVNSDLRTTGQVPYQDSTCPMSAFTKH
jgi:hypothetical protein